MLRRLLMVILMACLALPAVAAPAHCAPPAAEAQHHGGQHDGAAPQPKSHDCIGCAVPARPAAPLATAPFWPREMRQWHNAAPPPTLAATPETPPPRA